MPIDTTLAERKNAQVNIPLTLYRIAVSDNTAEDLYLTDWHTDLIHLGQLYQAFPIVHGPISENTEGRIDQLQITVANQNREIQYWVENNNALRGKRVLIRQTFYEELANPNGYVDEIYYIDGASCNENEITFTLTSRLDVLAIRLPRRRFLRDFCAWQYKGEGCWINSPNYSAPRGFITTAPLLYGGEVSGRYFGPATTVTLNNDRFTYNPAYTDYQIVAQGGVNAIDYLKYIDAPGGGITVGTQIVIRRHASQNAQIRVLKNRGGAGEINIAEDDYFKDYEEFIILQWDGAEWDEVVNARRKHDSARASFSPVSFPNIDASTQNLIIDLKCDHPERMTTNGQLEITSSGQANVNEWHFSDLTSLGITNVYQTFEIPLASFTTTGGKPDFNAGINFIRWYQESTGGMIWYHFKNVHISGQPDSCGKRLMDCKLHNNVGRFGGFPNVPSWRKTRV